MIKIAVLLFLMALWFVFKWICNGISNAANFVSGQSSKDNDIEKAYIIKRMIMSYLTTRNVFDHNLISYKNLETGEICSLMNEELNYCIAKIFNNDTNENKFYENNILLGKDKGDIISYLLFESLIKNTYITAYETNDYLNKFSNYINNDFRITDIEKESY